LVRHIRGRESDHDLALVDHEHIARRPRGGTYADGVAQLDHLDPPSAVPGLLDRQLSFARLVGDGHGHHHYSAARVVQSG
jgi:hypothetical protein